MNRLFVLAGLLVACLILSCKSDTMDDVTTDPAGSSVAVPDVYKKIYGASSITSDGTYITIKSNGMPDHKSAYYPTSNSLYESFSGKTFGDYTFNKNPNTIASQSLTFKIPLNPKEASSHAATPLGPSEWHSMAWRFLINTLAPTNPSPTKSRVLTSTGDIRSKRASTTTTSNRCI